MSIRATSSAASTPRSGRAVPAPAGRGSPRLNGRARAAGGSCWSAATWRADRRPSPPARPSGATTRGPPPRHPRTSPPCRVGGSRRRTSRRTGAASTAASPSATTGRAGRSAAAGRGRRPARRGSSRRARAPSAPPRSACRVPARARRRGQQHARLLEQFADRGDVSGMGRSPARGRRRAPPRPRPARSPTARRAEAALSAGSTRPPGKT